MNYNVYFSSDAEQDLTEIYLYFAKVESPAWADEMLNQIESICRELETFPERGQYPPELERIGVFRYRQVHVSPFRVIYEIAAAEVLIHCVFDGRRDLMELLERRMLRP